MAKTITLVGGVDSTTAALSSAVSQTFASFATIATADPAAGEPDERAYLVIIGGADTAGGVGLSSLTLDGVAADDSFYVTNTASGGDCRLLIGFWKGFSLPSSTGNYDVVVTFTSSVSVDFIVRGYELSNVHATNTAFLTEQSATAGDATPTSIDSGGTLDLTSSSVAGNALFGACMAADSALVDGSVAWTEDGSDFTEDASTYKAASATSYDGELGTFYDLSGGASQGLQPTPGTSGTPTVDAWASALVEVQAAPDDATDYYDLLWYSACCSRGIEEWSGSQGSPNHTTGTKNSGDASYELVGAATTEYLLEGDVWGNSLTVGSYYTIEGVFKFDANSYQPGTDYKLFKVGDSGTANQNVAVVVEATTGDLEVINGTGTVIADLAAATHGIGTTEWHTIRLDVYTHGSLGQVSISVDAGTAATGTNVDTHDSDAYDNLMIMGPDSGDGNVYCDVIAVWDTGTIFAPTDLPDTIEKGGPYQGADGTGFTSYTETGEGPDTGAIGDAGELPLATGAGSEAFYDTGSVAKGEGVATDGSSRAGPSGDLSGVTILGAKYMYWLDRQGGGGTTYYAYYGTKDETGGAAWYTNLDVENPDVGSSYSMWEYIGDSADLPTTSEYLAIGVRADGPRDLYIGEMYGSILYEPAAGAPANKHHIHLPLMGVG